mgnify:CR=1 FL=1
MSLIGLSCDMSQLAGEFCELCMPTSYGNATVAPGCLPCQCNGHGITSLGECDSTTGVCFCEEGYEGDNCDICSAGSVGDPRNAGFCYKYSWSRLLLVNATAQGGLTSVAEYVDTSYARWIITPFSDLDTVAIGNQSLMTVTIDSIYTGCPTVQA